MVTAPNDDWTEELCIKLIHEYRKRPMLWDPKDPFFFKKAMKPEAWEGIGAALNMPADVCKHKMVILQSSFRREKSKIMHSIKESPADEATYTSTWFAFEEMAFLIDKQSERKRQTTGMLDESCEDGPSAIKKSLIEHYNEKNSIESKKKTKKGSTSKIGTVLPKVCPKPSLTQVPAISVVAPPAEPEPPKTVPPLVPIPTRQRDETLEEIKSFTNFIAYKMKKYSETTKNSVQQAICDIIFKADQNYYENASFEDNFCNYQSPLTDATSEDCDLESKTIDLCNGQVITLEMHHSDETKIKDKMDGNEW